MHHADFGRHLGLTEHRLIVFIGGDVAFSLHRCHQASTLARHDRLGLHNRRAHVA